MLGNYVNSGAIILGCLIGILIKNGLKEKYKEIVMEAIGLSVIFIGASSAIKGLLDPDVVPVLFILSLVIGGLIGEFIGVEKWLESVGNFLQKRFGAKDQDISQGFVDASLIFCVGAMAIMGSLNSGLRGDHNTLFAKAILDGITSLVLTTTLGIGVIFSAVAVFLYQGVIVIFAHSVEPYLSTDIIREMTIVGSVIIVGIGLSMLNIKKIKTANLLPAIMIPVIYYLVILPIIHMFS